MNTPVRKQATGKTTNRKIPAHADYTDEVTPEQLAELKKQVEPLELETWEIKGKTAW